MDASLVEFHDFVVGDLLAGMEGITSKKMFGGYGLYLDGDIFAIILSEGGLYFKVDDTNRAQFEELGSEQFVYTGHKTKKPTAMPYWRLPDEILEDRDRLPEWVVQSADISRSTRK